MLRYKVNALKVLSLTLFAAFFLHQDAFAAFAVSVTPVQGGYQLDYGKVTPVSGRVNREITVRITSDIGKQYRLTQRLIQPLSTPGGSTIPQDSFIVYALRGSNSFGTMNVEQETPVFSGEQVLYTSNTTGQPDTFTLVYSLMPLQNISSGSYRGKIWFTLTPIDSTQEQVTTYLDLSAEIELASAIEIKTETGSKQISLKAEREQERSAGVAVNIQGGFGNQFRILQQVTEQPVSTEGKLLDWDAVACAGQGGSRGAVLNELIPLSAQQVPVYTSSRQGEADSFVLVYSLGDLSAQKAGRFRAKIKYFLEGVSFGQFRLIDTLDLEIENPRLFDIQVSPENQKGTIEFLNLRPTDLTPKRNEVIIEVRSNTGKQYQVTQNVVSELMNKQGEKIRAKYFTLRTESLETKGTLKFNSPEEVRKGQATLLVSDKEGSADSFRLIYELAPSRDLKAGDYSTVITYSLSEL